MTIRKIMLATAAAVTALAMAAPACAQANANQTAAGSMTLFLPIALAKVTDLSFGTVTRPTTGSGNVTVSAANGAVSTTGGISSVTNGPNAAASRATFNVSGEGGVSFSVTVPSTFNMTRSGGDPLAVTLTSTMASGTLSGTYGQAGASSFGVGGTVLLSSTTPTGAYTGSFNVTVAYN